MCPPIGLSMIFDCLTAQRGVPQVSPLRHGSDDFRTIPRYNHPLYRSVAERFSLKMLKWFREEFATEGVGGFNPRISPIASIGFSPGEKLSGGADGTRAFLI